MGGHPILSQLLLKKAKFARSQHCSLSALRP